MNLDQAMNREERLAIMTICGNVPEEEAQRYCDSRPELYGVRQECSDITQEVQRGGGD